MDVSPTAVTRKQRLYMFQLPRDAITLAAEPHSTLNRVSNGVKTRAKVRSIFLKP